MSYTQAPSWGGGSYETEPTCSCRVCAAMYWRTEYSLSDFVDNEKHTTHGRGDDASRLECRLPGRARCTLGRCHSYPTAAARISFRAGYRSQCTYTDVLAALWLHRSTTRDCKFRRRRFTCLSCTIHRVQKKRCHWFFCCNFYKYWRIFIIFRAQLHERCQSYWRKILAICSLCCYHTVWKSQTQK